MEEQSRPPSRGRDRSKTRSPTPRSSDSRSPRRRHRGDDYRPFSRSPTPPSRRNGRYRSRSDSRSRSFGRTRDRSGSRDRRHKPKGTKVVVEHLTRRVNEDHIHEIFGQFGRIKDLDLPMNRNSGTNRGSAYLLFDNEEDAEEAIAHMHEAQVDGVTISVSIVFPQRKMSPNPPLAKRGANTHGRGGAPPFPGGGYGQGASSGGGGARRGPSPGRHGSRSDVYRPGTRSPSPLRSSAAGPSRSGGGRYRSRSVSSRSRSRSPGERGGRGRYKDRRRTRSPSYDSYGDRSASRNRSRDRGHA